MIHELPAVTVENGIHYTLVGDYYFPTCTLQDDSPVVGRWADLYERHLREKNSTEYTRLIWACQLTDLLQTVQAECQRRLNNLIDQMAENERVTEHLKDTDPMTWVRKMNSIRSRAEEIIRDELLSE